MLCGMLIIPSEGIESEDEGDSGNVRHSRAFQHARLREEEGLRLLNCSCG